MKSLLFRCKKCGKEFSGIEKAPPCPRCGSTESEFVREYETAISGGKWPPDYDEIDEPCRVLVRTLNLFPGIETRESCCGHGARSFWIFLWAKDLQSIAGLLLALNSYLRGDRWVVRAEASPPSRPSEMVWFRLVSLDPPGQASYDAANDLAYWAEGANVV